jgi:hypothetical protein
VLLWDVEHGSTSFGQDFDSQQAVLKSLFAMVLFNFHMAYDPASCGLLLVESEFSGSYHGISLLYTHGHGGLFNRFAQSAELAESFFQAFLVFYMTSTCVFIVVFVCFFVCF